ncbi:MAG: UDP-N-acetylmuramoyl-tripeptide--D-alanyl-D-alanine ligase [Clostridia bacterium]|nr:UDP-N-acetylmuramoyl-tripeptide--D-alanyl-D-alanine ligase [Clostridia bacterium]
MFDFTLEKIAKITQGQLIGPQEAAAIEPRGASIDTRTLKPGDLFFALQGEKSDGHAYLEQAAQAGAVGAVVSYTPEGFTPGRLPLILLPEPLKALQQTALSMRRQFGGPVVAVTGSTGKTTTKDMVWSVLSEKGEVLRNIGNYNNELGVPLTLLSLEKKHWAIVLEMGMRALGEIDFLACLAEPDYGIITNVGHTHQELLGSQENIARAKAELIAHIPSGGGIILNKEDRALLKPWLSNARSGIMWIGRNAPADLWARDIREIWSKAGQPAVSFSVWSGAGKEATVELPVPGIHNVANALLAIGIARRLSFTWEEIKAGLQKLQLTAMRLELKTIPARKILLINDAYNANPASMQAALEVLKSGAASGGRAIAVLGDMYELGDYEEEGHRLVGQKVQEAGVSRLITVGRIARFIAAGAAGAGMNKEYIHICEDKVQALSILEEILEPQDVVLIKGSRGIKMEEIAKGLAL